MKYLVDTNHWSYIQAQHPSVAAHLRGLPSDATLCMSVVSQAELLAGAKVVEVEARREKLLALYREAIAAATEILPITSAVAEEFAGIYALLRRQGRPVGTNDMWIAATARAHDLVLVTADQHFQRVDGLRLEDWTTATGSGAGT